MVILNTKELKEKFNDFCSIKTGTAFSIPFNLLKEHYARARWYDVFYNRTKLDLIHNFIISSAQQRWKYNILLDDAHTTTWIQSHVNTAIISWLTRSVKPRVNINLYNWIANNMAGLWDGESKTLINIDFLENKKIFKVLDGNGDFTAEIKEFLEYKGKWVNDVDLLTDAIFAFKDAYITTKDEYMTSSWLKKQGFAKLVHSIENLEVTVTLDYLTPSQESNIYRLSGECVAPQVQSQLSMSNVKTDLEPLLFYADLLKKPLTWNELFKNSYIFDKNNKFLYKDVTDSLYKRGNKPYKEMEAYLIFLFASFYVDRNSNNGVRFSFPILEKQADSSFLKLMCRTTTNETPGFDFVGNMCSSFSKHQNSAVLGTYVNSLYTILKYITKFNTIAANDEYVKIYNNIDDSINEVAKRTNGTSKNKLKLRNANNIFNIIQYLTIGFINFTPNLKEHSISKVYKTILECFLANWIKFITSEDSLKHIELDKKTNFYSEHNRKPDGLLDIAEYEELALETVGKATFDFYELYVKDNLDNECGQEVSRPTERNKLKRFIEGKRLDNNFQIYNPHGEITHLSDFHVGHLLPESKGGSLQDKLWIFENPLRGNDNGVYKFATKDMEKYYIACANATQNNLNKFNEVTEDINKATRPDIEDSELSESQLKLRMEYNDIMNRKKCLKALFEFHNLEYKVDLSITENDYIIEFGK